MRASLKGATTGALLGLALVLGCIPAAAADTDTAHIELADPNGVVRAGGAAYGVAAAGGNACVRDLYIPDDRTPNHVGCGAIVRYDADGHVTTVHEFVPKEGARPFALRAGANGTLLGVTSLGGAHGRGTAFRFDPKTSTLDVLQSFESDLVPRGGAADAAAVYDDGAVLSEDDDRGNFFLLENGKSASLVWHTSTGTIPGAFSMGPDGRAVFTSLSRGACYVEIDSLERSGAMHVIATPAPNPNGCDPESAANLDLRVDEDDSVVTSNETQVLAGKATFPLAVIYTAPTPQPTPSPSTSKTSGAASSPVPIPPPGLFFNSADVQPNGDILVGTTHGSDCGGVGSISAGVLTELGTFDKTPICTTTFFDVESTTGGVVGLGVIPNSNNHVVAFGIPTGGKPVVTDVFDEYPAQAEGLALRQSIQPGLAAAGNKISLSWRVDGQLSMPDFSVTPAAIDIEMRDASRAGSPFVRLRPVSTKVIRSARTVMTFDSSFSALVPFVVPPLQPGRYEIIERGSAAIHANTGTLGILNDGAPSYLSVTPFDLSNRVKDPELAAIRKMLGGRSVEVSLDIPLACDSGGESLATRGSTVRVKAATRVPARPQTGYGPTGVHAYGPGDIATAYAPFYALAPITLTFDTIGNCASAAATFASIEDIKNHLRP